MPYRRLFLAAASVVWLSAPGWAQTPLVPSNPPPQTIPAPQNLAPAPPAPPAGPMPPGAGPAPAGTPELGRVFCNQTVDFSLAPRDGVPAKYRQFLGIFSDAAWTPQLCAALIVENVTPDGTATIVYAFGPTGSAPGPGGVLNGTGTVRDGALKFQNSDGSQYAFAPFYSDLEGHLLTPQGAAYEAIFKRTF